MCEGVGGLLSMFLQPLPRGPVWVMILPMLTAYPIYVGNYSFL